MVDLQKLIKGMTLEEKIGQLICMPIKGIAYENNDPDFIKINDAIIKYKIGGLILFHGDAIIAADLLNKLQLISKIPLLVSSDVERGVGQILKGGTEFPTNMALGATFNKENAYIQGMITAVEARSVGVHIAYAPVADVNSNPNNPIINTRSYGEDPEWVSKFVASYVQGIQKNNSIATAKHFPGHGDTEDDSHTKLPVLKISKEHFDEIESIPFQRAIEHGVGQIMTAHIAFPEMTNDKIIPSTLSKEIISHLLKDKLGFEGLIVSDALNMTGVRKDYNESEASILALEAGVDILLYPESVEIVIESITQAVISKRLSESRIEESVLKILSMKQKLGLFECKTVDLNNISTILKKQEHIESSLNIARSSITLITDNKTFVPFSNSKPNKFTALSHTKKCIPLKANVPFQLIIIDEDNSDNIADTFIYELRKRNNSFKTLFITPDFINNHIHRELENMHNDNTLIIAIFSKIKAWKERSGINENFITLINELLKSHANNIVISFGSPYIYNKLNNPDPFICTYSHSVASQIACTESLFNEIPMEGILPVSLKNHPIFPKEDLNELKRRMENGLL
ncbi:MAG: glycoside hydrolase family 3 protein [Spirochaetota bacterium]|nr:glycoside hydrolase family 3 protein [Spirochaetota bacterium]